VALPTPPHDLDRNGASTVDIVLAVVVGLISFGLGIGGSRLMLERRLNEQERNTQTRLTQEREKLEQVYEQRLQDKTGILKSQYETKLQQLEVQLAEARTPEAPPQPPEPESLAVDPEPSSPEPIAPQESPEESPAIAPAEALAPATTSPDPEPTPPEVLAPLHPPLAPEPIIAPEMLAPEVVSLRHSEEPPAPVAEVTPPAPRPPAPTIPADAGLLSASGVQTLAVLDQLYSTDGQVRWQLTQDLGAAILQQPPSLALKAVPWLGVLSQDSLPQVREAAIVALGSVGKPQVLPFLRKALRDTDSAVVIAASGAIDRFRSGGKVSRPLGKSSPGQSRSKSAKKAKGSTVS